MEYFEFTVRIPKRIPKPTRAWFQFRIRTLLIVMLVVGFGLVGWRTMYPHPATFEGKLRARDVALQHWREVHEDLARGIASKKDEEAARSRYFVCKDTIDRALQEMAERQGITEE